GHAVRPPGHPQGTRRAANPGTGRPILDGCLPPRDRRFPMRPPRVLPGQKEPLMFSLSRALACLALALPLAALPTSAAAETASGSAAYALVVGANRGGAGQERLRYAERDADNVAAVLTSIGGYRAANV